MSVVGANTPCGRAHDGVEFELLEHFLLDDGADAIAKQGAVGHDHGGAATTINRFSTGHRRTGHAACA